MSIQTRTVSRWKAARRSFTQRVRNRTVAMLRWAYWHSRRRSSDETQVVFIFGCQRSGTDMLCRVFERDFRASVLGEQSCITGHNGQRLRLKPFAQVKEILQQCRTPLVVAKPLVESQHADSLLRQVSRSKAIWMFRDYRDVARSNVKKFRSQIDAMRAIVGRRPGNWRSEGVSDEVHAVVAPHFCESMSRLDAAALMWYARNTLYFERELDQHGDVMLCKYEDLVARPSDTMRRVYEFLEIEFPGSRMGARIK